MRATATAGTMLEARALTKRFGALTVVDAVDLRLGPGTKTALLGANGAGKTTLLGMLATLIAPSAGDAWIDGVSLAQPPAELRRRIGVLAHSPMVYEELSPSENLEFFARLYGVPERAARIEQLLRLIGLWRRRDEPTHVLSRGQHQRLALARAVLHTPDVLLLDEPETGLDVDGVALLDELILSAPNLTVIAATHRAEWVGSWASGVIRLDRGRVVEDNTAPVTAGVPRPAAAVAR